MRTIWNGLVVGVLFVGLFGCASERPESVAFESGQWPILFGDPASDAMYDAVGALVFADDLKYGVFCTGTLVAPDVVVTAAHCLDSDVSYSTPYPIQTDELLFYIGEGPPPSQMDSTLHAVVDLQIHPNYDKVNLYNDIGVFRLAAPVTGVTPIPNLPANQGFTSADEGSLPLDFAGFGADDIYCKGRRCYFTNSDVRLHLVGVLDYIQSATQIYYLQPNGGPCFGDSGGPALVTRGNTVYLGGITSWGDDWCLEYGVSTRVDAFETYINDYSSDSGCESDADCHDNNECTIDSCIDSVCQNIAVADDITCGGGICCTGSCVVPFCSTDSDCGDGESCTADYCNEGGTCGAYCSNEWPACGLGDGCCGPECSDATDPDCVACLGNKESCTTDTDCCSGNCINGRCRGN